MTDNKTDVPCPTRTLAVRSDGTIVRGLAATRTEARRWLEAVQTHGRRTALAQVALAATTPGTPGEGHKGTTVSARNWRVVTDWTTPGPETYDPETTAEGQGAGVRGRRPGRRPRHLVPPTSSRRPLSPQIGGGCGSRRRPEPATDNDPGPAPGSGPHRRDRRRMLKFAAPS